MTDPLYLDDPTRLDCEATVERVVDDRVVLDRTCFYPEGGGQPADTGVLRAGDETWRVVDVQKRDTIYHHLAGDGAPPTAGTTVAGAVDADRRRAHSRYHTAQHLLSALLLAEYDAATTGNQLYADRARLDCRYERFTDDDLAAIETRLNELVDADLPVRWYTLDRAVAENRLDPERTRLDLLPDSITEVRIVEIGDADDPFDRTACAGTHVERTAEIGRVAVTGRETRGPEEERVRFRLADA
ncbi:alanyl-tRNA editing protein [Salinilacihabitans rarus]|uniref:alanyl-tRNA editing protein n=1 Tax=Salinilacihabitans rarus TaxID=2961596 RepID=UPI0020C8BE61|nr:alanyl-tRNA editing protein [Salinilacihabitans rarus]